MMMMMVLKGFSAVAVALAVGANNPTQAETGHVVGPPGHVQGEIVVSNGYPAAVVVYLEDAEGRRQFLGRVPHGEIELFDAPVSAIGGTDFRVRVYPADGPDPWSPWNEPGIKTRSLRLVDGNTVILWLTKDLTESSVEIRPAR